jgi:hypothetical protein
MVSRGERWALSQSLRRRSPASNCLRVTNPRASNHPSGDSVVFTVTDLDDLAGAVSDGIPLSSEHSLNMRGCALVAIRRLSFG